MNKLLLYSALAVLAQGAGCKVKDPFPQPPTNPVDQLPPATETGQRTFGCLLNGQAWKLTGNPLNGPLLTSQYSSRHLSVVARGGSVSNGVISGGIIQIDIDNISTTGQYVLSKKDTSFVNYEDFTSNCQYYTDAMHTATVDITRLDLVNRIVAGRFIFALETPGCGQKVVTEGRFDSRF